MKKEKNINYYRSLLHKDSIALLIVAIIFIIIILCMGSVSDESSLIFLKSNMFMIISIIIICNKKETKKFIGTLSIITACLMVLTSIGDGSLFGIVYFLLGIFLGIHSILYLIKFKNYNVQSNCSDEVVIKNSKMKYLSSIPIIISIIISIILSRVGIGLDKVGISFDQFLIAILVINIANIIFCIILHNKKIKSAFMYLMLAMSIIITLFSGLLLMSSLF